MRLQAITKPVQAVQRAKSLVGAPTAVCVLAVHSKFFNFTKDPFAATLFKAIKARRRRRPDAPPRAAPSSAVR